MEHDLRPESREDVIERRCVADVDAVELRIL